MVIILVEDHVMCSFAIVAKIIDDHGWTLVIFSPLTTTYVEHVALKMKIEISCRFVMFNSCYNHVLIIFFHTCCGSLLKLNFDFIRWIMETADSVCLSESIGLNVKVGSNE